MIDEKLARLKTATRSAVSRIELLGGQLEALSVELEDEALFDRAGGQQRRIAKARLAVATAPGAIDQVQKAIEQLRIFIDPKEKP